ncbi:hypothetical protein BD289DRAFT_443543 [Coniella lustricola]|uniref:Uncharacterized protein n=1 Tax=Coniella lustricola TaxID=2025994 RepID=A0A2T2ZWU0_9PEZI|nr:hypothetical protein BD289DRAFT_443543 [Coniella lustricola]
MFVPRSVRSSYVAVRVQVNSCVRQVCLPAGLSLAEILVHMLPAKCAHLYSHSVLTFALMNLIYAPRIVLPSQKKKRKTEHSPPPVCSMNIGIL